MSSEKWDLEGNERGDAGRHRAPSIPARLMKAATENIKEIVFGGLDGILTTLALVTAAEGAGSLMNSETLLIMGFANLVADGLGMGFGTFTSTRAEDGYTSVMRQKETWELEENPDGERDEMIHHYMRKGFSQKDAEEFIAIYMNYSESYVNLMMVEELGLPAEIPQPERAYKEGSIMLGAFVGLGSIPLLAYITGLPPAAALRLSLVLSALALFVLGFLKGKVTQRNAWRSGSEVVVVGVCASYVSYLVSSLVSGFLLSSPEHNE